MDEKDKPSRAIITMEEFTQGGYLTLRQFAEARGRNLSGIRGLAFRGALPVCVVIDAPNGKFRVIPRDAALRFEFPREGRPPVSKRLLDQQAKLQESDNGNNA